MEYDIFFSKREMPPFHTSRNFKHNAFISNSCEALNANNSQSNDTDIIKGSTENLHAVVELNEPESQFDVARSLQRIPKTLTKFPNNLTELKLTNQNVTDLPNLFKNMNNLRRLCIHDTLLSELPDSIEELKNLHDLDLSRNELKELPETVSNLKHLEKLYLCHNRLQKLPLSYAKLQVLRELDLSYNNFQRLPTCVSSGMGTLRVLDISNNPHVRINIIPSSKYLEKFIARNNKNCGTFPDWILSSKFFNMKEINLDNTRFDVYTFNGKEGNLYYTKLSMSSSNLSSSYLDMLMEHMISLQIVNVGNNINPQTDFGITGNVFNCIPVQNLKNPKFITELNFRGTGLATLPTAINELCNLKILDLGSNNITWFPDEFCELKKLEQLKIDGNNLILFPDKIDEMITLQEIHAENNSLQTLPESFQNLKNLRLIDLYNNKLDELPGVFCKLANLKGLDLELNHFTTLDRKIGNADYSALREYLKEEKCIVFRVIGKKREESDGTDSRSWKDSLKNTTGTSSDEVSNHLCISDESEENWDSITDTDDEFEPNSSEINYNERSRDYLRANLAPLGFCPADIHSQPIQQEVASMRVYGSMPSYKIVEGQFDDA